ncbi:tetratricopeptide repeat protein [Streptomyces sp. NPDC017993]|uniref:tetratricopeptide repeat protein n=1 Tax=Streptomyces sp. NPDC017993 TaxID=3365027 RepID=UPI00378A3585
MTKSHDERPTERHDAGHDGPAAAPRDPAQDAGYYGHGSAADRWARAQLFFEAKDFAAAARILQGLVDEDPGPVAPRLLLARAYYHSAQLRRAESELRAVLERDPVEEYAHLMLGRTLERQGRAAEAAPQLRIAAALGADTGPVQSR